MSRLIVHSYTISLDGYGAGPNQSQETPLGEGGEELHEWLVGTRFFHQMTGREGGTTGVDNEFAERGMANIGAYILGRNMFGPIRGPWPDESWRGWWGKNPPYQTGGYAGSISTKGAIVTIAGSTNMLVIITENESGLYQMNAFRLEHDRPSK